MSRLLSVSLLSLLLLVALAGRTAQAEDLVIYLHNAWYEKHKGGEPHPKFGIYDFGGIKAALGQGVSFEAPERAPDLSPSAAAAALVKRLEAEIAQGRDPSTVKVIGASKGAYIAMLASELMRKPAVRWVLIGGCNPKRLRGREPVLTGRVLSIYETSDTVAGPCPTGTTLTRSTRSFRQISTSAGTNHGFLFTPDPAWVGPATDW